MHKRWLALFLLLLSAVVAPARAQQAAAQPTPEQMISRLRYQWQGLFLASIANAKAHGQGPAQYGAALGRLYASSWPKDLTPQGLAHGILSNVELIGLKGELVEDTPERAVIRFSRPDSVEFQRDLARFGATIADWTEAQHALGQAMAIQHGLAWTQRRDGEWEIATITRKQ